MEMNKESLSHIENIKKDAKESKTRDLQAFVYKIVDSTNIEADRFACQSPGVDALLIADGQTAGSGRLGRSFYSPSGSGLYMTLLFHPSGASHDGVFYTAIAAVAVTRALEALTPLHPSIKWVNDLYVDGRKLCGILCKCKFNPEGGVSYMSLGVGVNLTASDMPEDIRDIVTSVEASGGGSVDRDELAVRICDEFFSALSEARESVMEFYRSHSLLTGRRVRVVSPSGDYDAEVRGIGGGGELLLETDDGERVTLSTGEVTVRVHKDG